MGATMLRASTAVFLAVLVGGCGGETPQPTVASGDTVAAEFVGPDPTARGAGGDLPADPGGEPGVPGSPAPEMAYRVGSARCFVYPGWIALVSPRSGVPGEDVVVVARSEGADAIAMCSSPPGAPAASFIDPGSPDYFFGIVGDHLLVDSGTGPRGRVLRVIDLSSGETDLRATYEEPVSLGEGVLEFSEPLGGYTTMEALVATGVNCPDAQAWFEDGFAIGVNRVVHYRLSDGARDAGGALVCVPLQ